MSDVHDFDLDQAAIDWARKKIETVRDRWRDGERKARESGDADLARNYRRFANIPVRAQVFGWFPLSGSEASDEARLFVAGWNAAAEYDWDEISDSPLVRAGLAAVLAARQAERQTALLEAADEVHREWRWQEEMRQRFIPEQNCAGRMAVVEQILRDRAAALSAPVGQESNNG